MLVFPAGSPNMDRAAAPRLSTSLQESIHSSVSTRLNITDMVRVASAENIAGFGDDPSSRPRLAPSFERVLAASPGECRHRRSASSPTGGPPTSVTRDGAGGNCVYTIGECLGEGSFGQVMKCVTDCGENVAIKVVAGRQHDLKKSRRLSTSDRGSLRSSSDNRLEPDATNINDDDDDSAFLDREITALRRLRHENIISLREAFSDSVNTFLVFEFIPGVDLLTFLQRSPEGVMSERQARTVFSQVMAAVQHCHSMKVAHRDIKLENIIVDENMNAKLIDFGLCWLGPPAGDLDDAVTRGDALTMCGTIDFCPPETMLRGAGFREAPELSVFDVDCWALGVVLFIMLFGVMPFNMQERMIMAPMGKHPAAPLPPRPLKPGQFSSVLDLLKQMLNLDYSLRPGLDAVAAHKWVDR